MLVVQGNLAITYADLGHLEKALSMERDAYFGWVRLKGEEYANTIRQASNYAASLLDLDRFEEVRSLLCKEIPLAHRVLGEDHQITLKMRKMYAMALYENEATTLDDLREAVTTLEDLVRTARRVLGGAHPLTPRIEDNLRCSRAALRARETPQPGNA